MALVKIEQAYYYYLEGAILNPPVCHDSVLNVGLGPGASARLFLTSRWVTRVVSIEINQSVIDEYRLQFPIGYPFENRHTIVLGNAATVPAAAINPPFDWVYIDTISAWDEPTFADLRAVVTRLKLPGAIAPGGGLTIEYQGDHRQERQFRQYMEDQGWTIETRRPELTERGWSRAGAMLIYRP